SPYLFQWTNAGIPLFWKKPESGAFPVVRHRLEARWPARRLLKSYVAYCRLHSLSKYIKLGRYDKKITSPVFNGSFHSVFCPIQYRVCFLRNSRWPVDEARQPGTHRWLFLQYTYGSRDKRALQTSMAQKPFF